MARLHYAPAETRALGVLAVLAVAALIWILLPLGVGVLLGALLAFTVETPYRQLARKLRRPKLVAFAVTAAVTVLVAGAIGVLVYLLVLQGVSVVAELPQMFAPGGEGTRLVNHFAAPLVHLRLSPSDLADRLRGAMGNAAATLATWAAQVLGVVADGALAFFFMAVTMFFVLVHWTAMAREAERLIPINPHHTRKLLRELSRLGRQTFVGNFGTAVVQGVLGGVGYWLTGVPKPAFFGALTAAAALVPVFGTLLVWVPAGVVLLLVGHPARGVFELAWGTVLLVGVSDYVLRPRLVGAGESMSTWITFVALFGGVKLFGVVGLLLGPVTVGLAVSALRIYGRTRRFRLGLP